MSTTTAGARGQGLPGGQPLEAAHAAVTRYTALGGDGDGLLGLARRCVRHAGDEVLGGAVADERLVAGLEGCHRLEAAVHAEKLRRIAEVVARQAWVGFASNPARLLVDRLGVTPAEARTLVDAAEMLTRMPKVAARLAAGEISAGHVAELARTMAQLKRLHSEGGGGQGVAGPGVSEETGVEGPAATAGAGAGDEAGAGTVGGEGLTGSDAGEAGGAADRLGEAVASLDDLVGRMGRYGDDPDGYDPEGPDAGRGSDAGSAAAAREPGPGEPGPGEGGPGGGVAGGTGEDAAGGTGERAALGAGEGAAPGAGEGAGGGLGGGAGCVGGAGSGGRPVDRRALRQRLRDWEHAHSPELLAERERRQRARRSLRVGSRFGDPDGMGSISGDLDAVTSAKAQQVIHALARKRSAADGRTFAQRCHDAFGQLLDRAIAAGELPDVAGEPPRVLLVVGPDTLHGRPGADAATLDGYGPLSSATARQMCCDAEVTVVVQGASGRLLNVGRDRRQPNRAQRRAVFARDRGCVGCGASLSRCQIHHVHWWRHGGRTDIDNLVAVCWDCHANIHHRGWQVTRRPDGSFTVTPPDPTARGPARPAKHDSGRATTTPADTRTAQAVSDRLAG